MRARDEWQRSGAAIPAPHAVKELLVLRVAGAHGSRDFLETGTYLGHMVEAMRRHFRKVVSLEIGSSLAQQASTRFARYSNVKIIEGDSAVALAASCRA